MTGTPDDVKATPENVAQANGGTSEAPDPVAELQAQLAEAQSKTAEYLDQLRRERASFENFRRRTDKEREEAHQNATINTLMRILPVIDDFERAIATIPAERAEDEVIKGFSLIHRKLLNLLETAGIKAIDPQGAPFDPAYHEAIGQDEGSDLPSGQVTVVLQKGYVYGERVLRPALVRVAS